MYRFEAMDAFVRVVRNGNFASAASELGLSPGVITKRVMQLEQMLGAKLLSRTTRRLSVTEIGQRYYKFCDRILREITRVLKPRGRLIAEIVNGTEEGQPPKFFESLAWPHIDDVMHHICGFGFTVLNQLDFERPWRGRTLVFQRTDDGHTG